MKAKDFIELHGWEFSIDVYEHRSLQEIPIDDWSNFVQYVENYKKCSKSGKFEDLFGDEK